MPPFTTPTHYIQRSIIQALVPKDDADDHSAMLEVRAGKSMHAMYEQHLTFDLQVLGGKRLLSLQPKYFSCTRNSQHLNSGNLNFLKKTLLMVED